MVTFSPTTRIIPISEGGLIPSAHLLVLATSERFLSVGSTFRAILASESHLVAISIDTLRSLPRGGLGIRGTQVKSSIQDIVDEVAPIKKKPLWGWGPIHSNVTSLD